MAVPVDAIHIHTRPMVAAYAVAVCVARCVAVPVDAIHIHTRPMVGA